MKFWLSILEMNTSRNTVAGFLSNIKSEETESHIKAHLWYLANSYFYNHKPSPRTLRQHRVLQNIRKNKDIIITKLS